MNRWLRKFSGWFLAGLTIGAFWVLIQRVKQLSTPPESASESEIPVPPLETEAVPAVDPLKAVAKNLAASGLIAKPKRAKKRPLAASTDDLTKIWGIGPKIAALLAEAGLNSYAQLAQAEPAQLQAILQSNGVPAARYESWPAQAELAAHGDWQALNALIEQLKSRPAATKD